jgi:hypothetical protein
MYVNDYYLIPFFGSFFYIIKENHIKKHVFGFLSSVVIRSRSRIIIIIIGGLSKSRAYRSLSRVDVEKHHVVITSFNLVWICITLG